MVDTTEDLLEGMRAMRIRQAILVTALLKLGEPLVVTRGDAYDSAAHDIDVQQTAEGFVVALKPATKFRRHD